MGDGRPERAGSRLLGVDVDPLVVAGSRGEGVDLVLGDRVSVGVAEVGAGRRQEIVDAVEDLCVSFSRPLRNVTVRRLRPGSGR